MPLILMLVTVCFLFFPIVHTGEDRSIYQLNRTSLDIFSFHIFFGQAILGICILGAILHIIALKTKKKWLNTFEFGFWAILTFIINIGWGTANTEVLQSEFGTNRLFTVIWLIYFLLFGAIALFIAFSSPDNKSSSGKKHTYRFWINLVLFIVFFGIIKDKPLFGIVGGYLAFLAIKKIEKEKYSKTKSIILSIASLVAIALATIYTSTLFYNS